MITMHARPRQTDRQTDKRTNMMAIARRIVLTNASRAKNCYKKDKSSANGELARDADDVNFSVDDVRKT